jgi:hypothetical protein
MGNDVIAHTRSRLLDDDNDNDNDVTIALRVGGKPYCATHYNAQTGSVSAQIAIERATAIVIQRNLGLRWLRQID